MKPLCIDLFCGLGGWADGFLAEGWQVIGFDIERHRYPAKVLPSIPEGSKLMHAKGPHGSSRLQDVAEVAIRKAQIIEGEWDEYPAELVLQDVLTLHGSQFRDADCIVASPPCQAYSYRAMPWKRAKALPPPDNTLFEACFRIQREASEVAGRYIPLVVENVRGAQRWVGHAAWHFGSFYLWGDVPALMPFSGRLPMKLGITHRSNGATSFHQKQPVWFNDDKMRATKCGGDWFGSGNNCSLMRQHSSKSPARKAASAQIAKIPFPLANWIARVYKPEIAA